MWILGDTKTSNSHPGDRDFSYFFFCQMLIERNQQDEKAKLMFGMYSDSNSI